MIASVFYVQRERETVDVRLKFQVEQHAPSGLSESWLYCSSGKNSSVA